MKKKILIIGLGRFGLSIAKTLSNMNVDILAVDNKSEPVEKASDFLQFCEVCDSSKKDVLEEINAHTFDSAIVSIGNLESTFLTVANLSELGVKNIYVRAESNDYEKILTKLGATNVIIPETSAATSLAHEVVSQNVLDYYEISKDYGVVKVEIPENFKSDTLINLDIRNKYDVNIVGIIRNEKFFIPKGTDFILPLDVVLIVGKDNKITKFESDIN